MKYKSLKKDGTITLEKGDEYACAGGADWEPIPSYLIGGRITKSHVFDYRRPIPDSKPKAVDWKRVAARMNACYGLQQEVNARAIYTRALAREKRSRK